jgi:ribosome-binding factor A
MARHRIKRVNEQLKREIARIVVGEVKDPRVGAVTVTRVVAAPDLTLARVFVHLLGDAEEQASTLEGLEAATPFIRSALGSRIDMRRVPEIRFERDASLEHALRIEKLLAEAEMGYDRVEDADGDQDSDADADADLDSDGDGDGEVRG